MLTRLLWSGLSLLFLGASSWAAVTPRHRLNYSSQEALNSNFNAIDGLLPFGSQIFSLPFCGQNFNTTTGYIGPDVASFFGRANALLGDATCDGYDSTTEATADRPIKGTFPAFSVVGMLCTNNVDNASDIVITARSNLANLSPSVTCTIVGTGTDQDCYTIVSGVPPIVASGATIATQVVTLEDLSANDVACRWLIEY